MVAQQEAPHRRRLAELQAALQAAGFAAAVISQPRDVFYYAGTGQPCNLWVPASREPVLFARRVPQRVQAETSLPAVGLAASYREMAARLAERGLLPTAGQAVAAELDVLPANLVGSLSRALPGVRLENVSPLILNQRLVKDAEEIARMRAAARLWSEIHQAVLATLAPGVTEAAVAATAVARIMAAGAVAENAQRRWDATSSAGHIVASGPNGWQVSGHAYTVTGVGLGPEVPFGYSNRVVQAGELVVVDFGLQLRGYHGDMARTYSVGTPTPAQRELWDRLLELHRAAIAAVRPGVTGRELYEQAAAQASRWGLAENFMGVGADRGQYLGHGLGLELDEPPVLGPGATAPLVPGMIITLEPKFQVPGVGAVMIEDTLLVTESGAEVLGTVPQELFTV